MALSYNASQRILKEVILGKPAPAAESDEARQWRKHCEVDVAKIRAQGFMPTIPADIRDDDHEDSD